MITYEGVATIAEYREMVARGFDEFDNIRFKIGKATMAPLPPTLSEVYGASGWL